MEEELIRSAKNAHLKLVREAREDGTLLLAEGVRLVRDALEAGLKGKVLVLAPGLKKSEQGRKFLEALKKRGEKQNPPGSSLLWVTDAVMQKLSHLKTPPGVLGVFERPEFRDGDFLDGEDSFVLVAAGVRDPGNLGALVRVAEAAGAGGVLALAGSADPFREKALRGASGSSFRLPLRGQVSLDALFRMLQKTGGTLLGLDAHEGENLFEASLGKGPRFYVLGGEGGGLPPELTKSFGQRLRIPMAPSVESLNVSVAAGIVLFEERRRRGER